MKQKDTKEAYINKIMELTGISRSTIFRYFAGNQIREHYKIKIDNAIASLNTDINKTDNQELEIVVSINSPDFDRFQGNNEALSGILEKASSENIKVRLERDVDPVKRPGIAVIVLGKHGKELFRDCNLLLEQDIPFVVINRMIENPKISYVAVDNKACGFELIEHLIHQGCTNFAFWGEDTTMVSRDKITGFNTALKQHNLSFSENLYVTDVENVSLETAFRKFMSAQNPPDAFVTLDDETALEVIRLAVTNGIKVPDDLAVSGMNDLGSSKSVIPSITSTNISFRKLGSYAVDTVLRLARDKERQAEKVIISHHLFVRDSTRKIK